MHWSSNDFSFGYPPPPWTDTQTGVKTLPSRRTTYAGGNKGSVSVPVNEVFFPMSRKQDELS